MTFRSCEALVAEQNEGVFKIRERLFLSRSSAARTFLEIMGDVSHFVPSGQISSGFSTLTHRLAVVISYIRV